MTQQYLPEDDDGSLDQLIELHTRKETPVYQPRIELRQRAAIIVIAVLLLVCGSLAAFKASAQSVPGKLTLSWKLPTQGCTLTQPPVCVPLTGDNALQAVHVWIDTKPIPDQPTGAPALTLAAGATVATHTMQVANGATLYARVSVRNPAGDSPLSEQKSKVITAEFLPGVPTDVTITLEIGT